MLRKSHDGRNVVARPPHGDLDCRFRRVLDEIFQRVTRASRRRVRRSPCGARGRTTAVSEPLRTISPPQRAKRTLLNVLLQNEILMRRLRFGIFGGGAVAAVLMAVFGPVDARLPWYIIALFLGGSVFDMVRDKKAVP